MTNDTQTGKQPTRRGFLAGCGLGLGVGALGGAGSVAAWVATDPIPAPIGPALTLDIHTHLFGVGDGGTGCRLSAEVRHGLTFRMLVTMLRLNAVEGADDDSLDARYRAVFLDMVRASGVDRCAVLAQDAVYDATGRMDEGNTHFYVPNDYVLDVCHSHSDRLIPCVSINPDRRDALDELDRCVGLGVRMLKIHPPTQGVDVSDRKHAPFFRKCADYKLLVLVHTGHEHAAPVIDIRLADPVRLELALDLGCRVVACHAGTGRSGDKPDFLPGLIALIARHEQLWADSSVLCSPGRKRDFDRVMNSQLLRERLVHGSDFPFPALPILFADRVGRKRALELTADHNLVRRDFLLKKDLGLLDCAERGYRLVMA